MRRFPILLARFLVFVGSFSVAARADSSEAISRLWTLRQVVLALSLSRLTPSDSNTHRSLESLLTSTPDFVIDGDLRASLYEQLSARFGRFTEAPGPLFPTPAAMAAKVEGLEWVNDFAGGLSDSLYEYWLHVMADQYKFLELLTEHKDFRGYFIEDRADELLGQIAEGGFDADLCAKLMRLGLEPEAIRLLTQIPNEELFPKWGLRSREAGRAKPIIDTFLFYSAQQKRDFIGSMEQASFESLLSEVLAETFPLISSDHFWMVKELLELRNDKDLASLRNLLSRRVFVEANVQRFSTGPERFLAMQILLFLRFWPEPEASVPLARRIKGDAFAFGLGDSRFREIGGAADILLNSLQGKPSLRQRVQGAMSLCERASARIGGIFWSMAFGF